jgi:hypothetical protein
MQAAWSDYLAIHEPLAGAIFSFREKFQWQEVIRA